MRSPITRELKRVFDAEMRRRLPNFERVKKPKLGQHPKWIWKLGPDLEFFIKLQPLEWNDHFVLEIGWTTGGELDSKENYQSSIDIHAQNWGTRLTELWKNNEGIIEQVWDVVPKLSSDQKLERIRAFNRGEVDWPSPPDPSVEEVMPRVVLLVRDAADKLEQYALPLFKRVAEARGYTWPLGKHE